MAVSFWTVSQGVNLTKCRTLMFSPIAAILCLTKSFTETLSSLMKGCSRRASSPNLFEILPSTIFSLIFSGFEERSSLCISSSFSFFTMVLGISSIDTNWTCGQASTCIAKLVSQFPSIKTPMHESWMNVPILLSAASLPNLLPADERAFFFLRYICLRLFKITFSFSKGFSYSPSSPAPVSSSCCLTKEAETTTVDFLQHNIEQFNIFFSIFFVFN